MRNTRLCGPPDLRAKAPPGRALWPPGLGPPHPDATAPPGLSPPDSRTAAPPGRDRRPS